MALKKADQELLTKIFSVVDGVYAKTRDLEGASVASADKLGSSTVGSSEQPIYLSSGTATASSSTVGSSTTPVYLNAGVITACSSTRSYDETTETLTLL